MSEPNVQPPTGADAAPNDKPVCILVRPQLGENIGAAARAMANFTLDRMRLVSPRDGWPNVQAQKSASGALWVVDDATVHTDTTGAVADLNWVMATTARPRDMAKPVLTPREAAIELRRRAAAGERVGMLFGPERTGLDNDEVALADAIVMAPVNPAFASINLSQAVLLCAYEWYLAGQDATLGRHTAFDGLDESGMQHRNSRPATRAEMVGFFEHIEEALDRGGFFRTAEKRPTMVRNIRNMFLRMAPTEQEVRTLRGIVASLTNAHKRRGNTP